MLEHNNFELNQEGCSYKGGIQKPKSAKSLSFHTSMLGSWRGAYKACLRYLDCIQAGYISLSRRRL